MATEVKFLRMSDFAPDTTKIGLGYQMSGINFYVPWEIKSFFHDSHIYKYINS